MLIINAGVFGLNKERKSYRMELVKTADGSSTLYNAEVGEHYHSKHGALQESKHVFLKSGLEFFLNNQPQDSVSILEIGFGTGLNYLLTADYCLQHDISLNYIGIEKHPLSKEVIIQTGNINYVSAVVANDFISNYDEAIKSQVNLGTGNLLIDVVDVKLYQSNIQADIIYFDAFAAVHQPEMWSEETLAHVCSFIKPRGVFVTYAITGNLKRTMKSLGFQIEKVPGALGKREMLRAIKL